MTKDHKEALLALLDRHKELGISEQMMNLDLKVAYEYGMDWIKGHQPITTEWLITLASKVMARTDGRTCRLLMNLIQMEFGVLPVKVLKEDKEEYIQALIETRENDDVDIFVNLMAELHCRHLKADIDQYMESIEEKMVDKWSIKPSLAGKMADILIFMTDKREVKTEDVVSRFGITATTAKRYLRQLTEFGYLEARGGNRNRRYVLRENTQG